MKRREFLKHTGCGMVVWLGGKALAAPQMPLQPTTNQSLAIQDDVWKLVYSPNGPTRHFQLYNLQQDVGEYWDLASKYPEVIERMTERFAIRRA